MDLVEVETETKFSNTLDKSNVFYSNSLFIRHCDHHHHGAFFWFFFLLNIKLTFGLIVVHCTPDFEIIIWNQLQGFKSLINVLSIVATDFENKYAL